MKLDAYDVKILAALQRDGRMTKLKLAKDINLSPSPCWERLRRLEKAGLIRGYHAEVDIDRLLPTFMALVEVMLKSHRPEDFDRFETRVKATPEIVECYAIGGGFDYLLRIVTVDIQSYQRLVEDLLDASIGIDRYYTYAVTESVKPFAGYPLQRLLAQGGIAKDKSDERDER